MPQTGYFWIFLSACSSSTSDCPDLKCSESSPEIGAVISWTVLSLFKILLQLREWASFSCEEIDNE
jgi:hypothetical protein